MTDLELMPAITVRLPWVKALATGDKPVENRGRAIAARYIGERIALHASSVYDRAARWDMQIMRWWWGSPKVEAVTPDDFTGLPRKVIAVGTLADCHQVVVADNRACCAPWGRKFHGVGRRRKPAWHLVFSNVVELEEPVTATGKLWFPWMLPAEQTALVLAQLPKQVRP